MITTPSGRKLGRRASLFFIGDRIDLVDFSGWNVTYFFKSVSAKKDTLPPI